MEIFDLKQRTKAWYQHRSQYINATEIATITDNNPFKSLAQLVHDKLFGTTFVGNKFTDHGILMEPIAKKFFENLTQKPFTPTIFVDDEHRMFSASLDGYHAPTQTVLEIKVPFVDENQKISTTWNKFLSHREIPMYYYCQIQCQLFCSNAKKAYFFVYFSETNYLIEEVFLNPTFINTMINKSKDYLVYLNAVKSELMATTYLRTLAKKNL